LKCLNTAHWERFLRAEGQGIVGIFSAACDEGSLRQTVLYWNQAELLTPLISQICYGDKAQIQMESIAQIEGER
jgi:hypothetical protein